MRIFILLVLLTLPTSVSASSLGGGLPGWSSPSFGGGIPGQYGNTSHYSKTTQVQTFTPKHYDNSYSRPTPSIDPGRYNPYSNNRPGSRYYY